jgi:hypothetical protein
MGIGSPGKEQFRDVIVEMRNRHVAAGIAPLMLMREELVTNDDFTDRGGMDDPTRDHFIRLLVNCDKYRRRITHNPSGLPLGDQIAKAIDTNEEIETGKNPAGGDNVQSGSKGLYQIPFAFDGTNPNIPLNSSLDLPSNNGLLLLGAIDDCIVAWSRLNSRDRSKYITQMDSMRIYGGYQEILEYLNIFAGDKNRVDVAQVRATDEPRGPDNSPNRKSEAVGDAQTGQQA